MDATMGLVILTAIGLMSGFLAWYTNITVKDQLGMFKETLRRELEAREQFLENSITTARIDPLRNEMAGVHARIGQIEDYAHKNAHDLRDLVHELQLRVAMGERK